ncbi:hypothetical protein ACMA5I_10250 [Paracoccaceae bacterium GXU_MW_L88]
MTPNKKMRVRWYEGVKQKLLHHIRNHEVCRGDLMEGSSLDKEQKLEWSYRFRRHKYYSDEDELETLSGYSPEVELRHLLLVLDKDNYKNNPYWYGLETTRDNKGRYYARICRMYGSGVDEHYDATNIEIDLTQPFERQQPEVYEQLCKILEIE